MSTYTYRPYRRTAVAEMADWHPDFDMTGVSVSDADRAAGSPKHGDKIARNPANHADRWLVAADYFAANFAPMPCPVCGQADQGQTGEYACPDCGLPTLHDTPDTPRAALVERHSAVLHRMAHDDTLRNHLQAHELDAIRWAARGLSLSPTQERERITEAMHKAFEEVWQGVWWIPEEDFQKFVTATVAHVVAKNESVG